MNPSYKYITLQESLSELIYKVRLCLRFTNTSLAVSLLLLGNTDPPPLLCLCLLKVKIEKMEKNHLLSFYIGCTFAIWKKNAKYTPKIRIDKNTVTVLLLVVKMPCTQGGVVKRESS